jgi:hypothetical protein
LEDEDSDTRVWIILAPLSSEPENLRPISHKEIAEEIPDILQEIRLTVCPLSEP